MRILIRAIGFVVFALATQFFAWVSGIDVLEDFNIFALPRTMVFLAIATVVWIVIDGIAGSMRSEAKRPLLFCTLCAACGIAAAVVPPFMSGDGLAIGLMRFFLGMWVITIAAFGLITWIGGAVLRKRRRANQAFEAIGDPGSPQHQR